jgi:hypothetical protein
METCPNCRKSFPDGTLMNVFISRNNNYTQELLYKDSTLEATKGLYKIELKLKMKKKWCRFWK